MTLRKPRRPVAGATPADTPPEIVQRPDGYYWILEDALGEVGPFESYELARNDRDAGEETPEPGEGLPQAQQEIGINEWLDAETGQPAEGQSPTHFDED